MAKKKKKKKKKKKMLTQVLQLQLAVWV